MRLMTWSDLYGRPRPKGAERIAYGTDPNQVGDLWRPDTTSPGKRGLHPLVIMIHGGCWEAATASLDIMGWAAADLRDRGYVVWNIEYRRIDQSGGGWPGTYEDVRQAIDYAYVHGGAAWGGDLRQALLLGHSAGGHLALWAAKSGDATALKGVVALGAIADLVHDTETACGLDGLAKMLGPDPAKTSPYQMAPLGVPTMLITGAQDKTVPAALAVRYAAHAKAGGDTVEMLTPPGGHVEEIAPGSEAWTVVVNAIARLIGPPTH
jgi:acetyl esterase/lipase